MGIPRSAWVGVFWGFFRGFRGVLGGFRGLGFRGLGFRGFRV